MYYLLESRRPALERCCPLLVVQVVCSLPHLWRFRKGTASLASPAIAMTLSDSTAFNARRAIIFRLHVFQIVGAVLLIKKEVALDLGRGRAAHCPGDSRSKVWGYFNNGSELWMD